MKIIYEHRIREATLSYKRINLVSDNRTDDMKYPLKSPVEVVKMMRTILDAEGREVLFLLFLGCDNRIRAVSRAFIGTSDQAVVYPREIMKYCILSDTSRFIMCHNHPSNIITPSEHDVEITNKIKTAAQSLDIELLDHLVITDDAYYSFREHGLL